MRIGRVNLPSLLRSAAGRPQLQKADGYTATLPVGGRWHGLKLTAIAVSGAPDSDWSGFELSFQATFEEVRAAANAAGLAVPKSGSRVFVDELSTTIAIRREGTATVLSCFT